MTFNDRFKSMNEKFVKGECIEDNEVLELFRFYQELDKRLSLLGLEFQLSQSEVWRRIQRLKDFIYFRKLDFL